MTLYKTTTTNSIGFLGKHSLDTFDVYESNKKKMIESKDFVGEQVDLNSDYYCGVVKDNAIQFIKLVPVDLQLKYDPNPERLIQKSADKRNQLGIVFGTKKRKQQIKQQEMNQIDITLLSDTNAMNQHIQQNSLPEKQDLEEQSFKDRLIPPCDINAPTPQKVYNRNDILPNSMLGMIDIKPMWKARELNECFSSLQSLNLGTFVQDKMTAILMEKQKEDKDTLKYLLFLAYLMKFYNMSPKQFGNENWTTKFLNGASPVIGEHIASLFLTVQGQGEDSRYIRDAKGKDKLLAYILCLSLMLNHYQLDCNRIASDLKVSVTTIVKSCKELGCRVDSNKQGKKAALQIPLVFPKKSRGM